MSVINPGIIEAFSTELIWLKSKYNVKNKDIYNKDEKGF